MKLILVFSTIIVTISAIRRQFNCTTDVHQNDGSEMNRAGCLDLGIHFRWNKKVPYFFDYTVMPKDKALIRKQMKVIEEKTCIKFTEVEEYSAPSHRLKITNMNKGSCLPGFVTS